MQVEEKQKELTAALAALQAGPSCLRQSDCPSSCGAIAEQAYWEP